MKILVDAFGGDNAPLEIIKGSLLAKEEYGFDIILCGDESLIKTCARENGIDITSLAIKHAEGKIPVEADPRSILKKYNDCSMAVGLKALAEGEGDAFVSAGSTGALVVGATFIVKRIKGIRRPAIASIMPSDTTPFMLMDCGANVEVTPEGLHNFGVMASIFMKKVMGVSDPRVGLLNIGAEDNKGTDLYVKANELMRSQSDYNFIGNVESREVPFGAADVVVADGFTGNIFLKTYEGAAMMVMKNIKAMYKKNALTKVSALGVKSGIMELKDKMDYNKLGGAPIMGVQKPVIKAHGSSGAEAIKNAIHQAEIYANQGVIEEIANAVAKAPAGEEE